MSMRLIKLTSLKRMTNSIQTNTKLCERIGAEVLVALESRSKSLSLVQKCRVE